MKKEVEIKKSYRLINYGPVVLITSGTEEKANVSTIAWCMPMSANPVLVGIAVSKKHYTTQLIKEYKEFAVNVPSAEIKDKVVAAGKVHGHEIDKISKVGFTKEKASKIKTPLIKECFANLECSVKDIIEVGDHFLFVGEIASAQAEEGSFPDNIVDTSKIKTLQHLGGNNFASLKSL